MKPMDCIAVLKALSDLSRMRIMRLLLHDELSVGDIAEQLAASHYNVSKHLRVLREAGLVETKRRGKHRCSGIVPELARHLASNKNVLELKCCTFRFDDLPK